MTTEKAGLYVHFPFCHRKCPYCHFASAPPRPGDLEKWMGGLLREVELYAGLSLEFDTLYLGGGTPSLLDPEGVRKILALLKDRLSLRLEEFTLEANPSSFIHDQTIEPRMMGEPGARPSALDEKVLAGWASAGVTRLSIGAQSFDDDVLDTLGRAASEARTSEFIRQARRAGFASVGLDLMVGVPGETRCGLVKTLAGVRRAGPDHVSLYLLENVEGLPFEAVLRQNPVEDDAAADAFEFLAAGLEAEGLKRYEISNFARPGRESRHNLKYWRFEPFLGLGPSAASHLGDERWTNAADLDEWAAALEAGRDPRVETIRLAPEQAAREALISGLRLAAGVDLGALRERFGIDLGARFAPEIGDLARDGFLVRRGERLLIPAEKMLVSNAVLSAFV
jgi:oxygen-independent coproporphyrinogen III oxidase